jgi:hypothetical protein
MKTEVVKFHKWGFILSEQELRRLAQTCHEHILKICETPTIQIKAGLKDGSVVESDNIDDILKLENAGSKRITYVSLDYANEPVGDWQILVTLRNPILAREKGWTSIYSFVSGNSRDWAFLADAEIEERVKKVSAISASYILDQRWFNIVLTVIGMFLFIVSFSSIASNATGADKLEEAYKSGAIKDPIEAMIFLERSKTQAIPFTRYMLSSFALFSVPFILGYGLSKLYTWLSPEYNFTGAIMYLTLIEKSL